MRSRFFLASLVFIFIYQGSFAQQNLTAKPKLVVGLVIDQMRWDYLYRFNDLYGKDGFRRLLREGFSFENTMIPYTPTYTAVGHTCIYTGSIPAVTGIVGNNWYDRRISRSVYCTDDSTVNTVGSASAEGKMSPENMWTTTIGDELRLSNNFKSRVFGVSLKDRGSIFPAGHSANAAYWFDTVEGKWISSTFYMPALPDYVSRFNDKNIPADYMRKTWNTLLPIGKYTASTDDNEAFEDPIPGLNTVTFPHDLSLIKSDKFEAFKYTPFSIDFTFDLAKLIFDNEKLGSNNVTDFLAISISSTDYIGHHFGPNSIETADTYVRLDKNIAGFLKYLDDKLGKGNYVFFLSADHGVAHIPGFLKEHHIPAGIYNNTDLKKEINTLVNNKYGITNIVSSLQNYQVYLNRNSIIQQGKNEELIIADIIALLKQKEFITAAVETEKIRYSVLPEPQQERMINGYNMQRSGDILFTVKPQYFDHGVKGTTHGSWNPYDAHIPLLFFGGKIKAGKTNREVYMTDIAPTLAAILQVQMPNGSVGKVLPEVVN